MKVYVAQINSVIGNLEGNFRLIVQESLKALQQKCDVIVFPELATTGYPPKDLLRINSFWEDEAVVIDKLLYFLKEQNRQITVIVGGLHEVFKTYGCVSRFNAAWVLDKHFGKRVVHKKLLPSYDVFDEVKYFNASEDLYRPTPVLVRHHLGQYSKVNINILICEDIWNNNFSSSESNYSTDPVSYLQHKQPLFVLNASPFYVGKILETQDLIKSISNRIKAPVVWCNQVGAHDDIVTGGYSMVSVPSTGFNQSNVLMAKPFEQDSLYVQLSDDVTNHNNFNPDKTPIDSNKLGLVLPKINEQTIDKNEFDVWCIYKALCLHVMDYKSQCGFKTAVLGLSGGIDSAVVAVIAVHVFGSENLVSISMPSKFSSKRSVSDAQELADNLKIQLQIKEIKEAHKTISNLFLSGGKQKFDNSLTDENIQPRIRGLILMAHSNEFPPCLVLTTGNKSELAQGYCTLYGDTCGGLAVLSDVWKTDVFNLAKFINKYFHKPIPDNIINKPPSAELKEDQIDSDSLLDYDILDPILKLFIEKEKSLEEVCILYKDDLNVKQSDIIGVYNRYVKSEYKRQQLPPGPKVSRRGFSSGRRMPIAMKRTKI